MNARAAILILLLPAGIAAAADLYLAPWGQDAQDGRAPVRAVQTLGRAVRLATNGDTIRVAGGVYAVHPAHRFTIPAGLSGVRITAEPNAKPIFRFGDGTSCLDYFIACSNNRGITIDGLTVENIGTPFRLFGSDTSPGACNITLRNVTIRQAGRAGMPGGTNGRGVYIRNDSATAPMTGFVIENLTVEGCSETGLKIAGNVANIAVRGLVVRDVDDGRGVDGDGDGVTVLALSSGAPDRIVISGARVERCSEDGMDLTGTNVLVDRVDIRNVRACGLKLWSPGAHYGAGPGSFVVNRTTSEGDEAGLKSAGAPSLAVANSTFAGGEYGLRAKTWAGWSGTLTASYCLFSSLVVEPGVAAVLNRCASPAGGPGLLQQDTRPADLRADFNGDGRVDGMDFLRWQAGRGDADGDGATDARDFLIWQATTN